MSTRRPGDSAPAFALPLATGGTLRLDDLRGQPLLLIFMRHLH